MRQALSGQRATLSPAPSCKGHSDPKLRNVSLDHVPKLPLLEFVEEL